MPASRGFDNAVQQMPPPSAAHRGLDGPARVPAAAPAQSKMMWSPGGGGGGSVSAGVGGGGADQPLYRQSDVSSRQHVPGPRSRPVQFSTTDATDHAGAGGGHDRGAPWRSRDGGGGGGGGGAWNQGQHHGPSAVASSPERHRQQQQQQQQQQQRGRTQAMRDDGSQGHPAKTSVSSHINSGLYPVGEFLSVRSKTYTRYFLPRLRQ